MTNNIEDRIEQSEWIKYYVDNFIDYDLINKTIDEIIKWRVEKLVKERLKYNFQDHRITNTIDDIVKSLLDVKEKRDS